MNFLNLENRSFENINLVTLKKIFDIPLLNKVFVSLIELKNILQKHPIKERGCKFKIDQITY